MNYKVIQQTTAAIALLTILAFMSATLISELNGDHHLIAFVKMGIVYGLTILFLCMPLNVISSRKLAAIHPDNYYVNANTKRVKWIAINGVLFLIPLAFTLYYLARNDRFDSVFFSLQVLEIVCGSINIYLFGRMILDNQKVSNSTTYTN